MSGLLLADLSSELQEHLGVSSEYSNAWYYLLINRAFWSISDLYPFRLKETNSTLDTVQGTRRYEMPVPYEALRHIVIEEPVTGQHTPLDRMSLVDYETKYQNDSEAEAFPTKYLRYEDDYILYPTPDDVYTVTVHYWTIFDDLADDNTDPLIPRVWHEVILYASVYRGFLKLQDFNKAREMKAHLASIINDIVPTESKEEIDSRNSRISVPDEWTRVDYKG